MTIRRSLIVCGIACLFLFPSTAQASTGGTRATIFVLHETSYEELTTIPGVSLVASAGGEALLANADELVTQARELEERPPIGQSGGAAEIRVVDLGTPPEGAADRSAFLAQAGERIGQIIAADGSDGLVVVASVGTSSSMRAAGDELNGVVVADAAFLGDPFGPTALTSSSTRRAGVVTGSDLRPTVAAFIRAPGEDWAGEMQGVDEGSVVLSIHERYLAARRAYVPVAIAAVIAVFLIAAFAVSVFARRTRVSRRTLRAGMWACFATPAMAVAMLAVGHLPQLRYTWIALSIVAITLALPTLALASRRKGVLVAPAVLGMVIIGLFIIEAATGWYGTMFTMLGGTALDGARFYGLPNAFEGLLVGSAVYIAAGLAPRRGYVGIVLVALFVGAPGLGADLGGAVVLLVAAGIWFALRTRGRLGGREVATVAATVVVGIGLILLLHRLTSSPTHGTAFVEASGRDPMDVFSTLWQRLGIGIDLLRRNPLGLTYLAATPVLLWLVAKRRGGLRDSFAEFPQWRAALMTVLWASVVAYFVNDTGVSAVGMGFAMALGGILYVPLAREAVSMDAR